MKLDNDAIEALKILVETCQSLGIKLTLIGASALVVYSQSNMLPAEDIEATRDIDTVTSALNWDDYDRFVELLFARGFTRKSREAEHKFSYKNAEVDILPYGKDLIDGHHLVWRVSNIRMSTQGLHEALILSTPFEIEDGLQVLVPPPWLIVYLKIVAYLEDSHGRRKDIRDILVVLRNYESDPEKTRRFGLDIDLDYEVRGAFLIGRDIAENLRQKILGPVIEFFNKIEDEDSVVVGGALGTASFRQSEAFLLFAAMKQGFLAID